MFKVGDKVTWRNSPNALALTGCIIRELGHAEDGAPAAMIDIGRFSPDGEPVGALLSHLHLED